ncbi:MAG: hypothetical protein PWR28_1980 [Synergistaceae bacterium]|nr:hypothetical protein [Synergistaceae bacterium]
MLRGAKNRMVMEFLVLRAPRCSATYCPKSAEGEECLVRTEFQGKAYEAFKALGLRPPEKVQPVLATVEATPL